MACFRIGFKIAKILPKATVETHLSFSMRKTTRKKHLIFEK